MGTKKPRKCGAMGTQERVETREHENMWLEKIPAGNQNKTWAKKKVIAYI